MSQSPQAGSQLGIWTLEAPIGAGGMGQVWRATAPHGTSAALKLLLQGDHESDAFEAEAAAMARLVHPRIIRILDFGRTETDAPYLVMDLARGPTVAEFVEREQIGWGKVLQITRCILEALAHAHSRGLTHRDLKPANVIAMNPDGSDWRLTDFGIAHLDDAPSDARDPLGTPLYMAPEQFIGRSRDFGPWTDLYALGCVIYQLVYGEPPFSGAPMALAFAHLKAEVEERTPRFETPEGLDDFLGVLLRKDPLSRFRGAPDALRALEKLPAVLPSKSTAALPSSDDARTVVTPPFEPTVMLGDLDTFEWHADTTDDAPIIEPAVPPRDPPQTSPRYYFSTFHGDTGPGLAQLRELPFAGRLEERSQLWRALDECVQTATRRTVLITGARGIGKSALALWLCNCVAEHGYARPIQLPVNVSVTDGLLLAFRRLYRLRELEPEEARARLRRWVSAPEWAEEVIIAETPPEDTRDLHLAAAAILRAHCEREPVVLFIDDASDQKERELLLRSFAGLTEDVGRLMIVATVRPSSALLPDLAERDDVRIVELGPVSIGDCAGIIQEVIALDAETAIALARKVNGNPRMAIEAVRDWIANDLLTYSGGRWELRGRTLPDLPHTGATRALQRLDDAMGHDAEARQSLEVAALFGSRCLVGHWRTACAAAGVFPPGDFLREATRYGIIVREGGWIGFRDHMVREFVAERSIEEQRAAAFHAAIVPVIRTNPGDYDEAALGTHLWGAGEHHAAIEPLIEAAERRLSEDWAAARTFIDRAAESLESIGEVDTERRWRLRLLGGRLLATETHVAEARAELTDVIEAARDSGWAKLECEAIEAVVQIGSIHFPDHALTDLARRGVDLAEEIGDPSLIAPMRSSAGAALGYVGLLDEALAQYTAAREVAEASGDESGIAEADYGIGWVLFLQGHYEAALDALRGATDSFRELGRVNLSMKVHSFTGDVARAVGRLDAAESIYSEVHRYMLRVGLVGPVIPMNFALIEVARGRFEEALRWARHTAELLGSRRPALAATVECVKLLHAASTGDREIWDQSFEAIRVFLAGGSVHYDLAYALDVAARETYGNLDDERAGRVLSIAVAQWEQLGREAEAETLRQLSTDLAE